MWLIDTNIVIYYLNGDSKARNIIKSLKNNMAISLITVIEVLSHSYDELEKTKVEQFLRRRFVWLDISHDIVLKTADIRRIKKTKTPDAIIGATALIHGLPLVTRNVKDFSHLPLILHNPID